MNSIFRTVSFHGLLSAAVLVCLAIRPAPAEQTVRVFIFAGQSNMVGSDSRVEDIGNFPPFEGLEKPQTKVRFSYCLGRENKTRSDGWGPLQPVNRIVGPELSFARRVTGRIADPIAIIKCAAGGTHLGGDWNPEKPEGFKMYPLAMKLIQDSLKQLSDEGIPYRIEAVMWHQGENDMFNEQYMANYGKNLEKFVARWRKDLQSPRLPFFIGELCTKTIWGMDLRPRMYAISQGQKYVAGKDPRVTYVPTAQIGVEIGGGVGLHYHYGTLGQLQHGENYAQAYLASIGEGKPVSRKLEKWPYQPSETVKLFVLAGHRNMEGERAFASQLKQMEPERQLAADDPTIAFKYDLGGSYRVSDGWEPLGLTGYYETFGPELSFARRFKQQARSPIAVAKFTHSGSQIIDWTPEGSMAKSRMLYSRFTRFVRESIEEIRARGTRVELAGILYHVGENDMSFYPYRKDAAKRIDALIRQSREDLQLPELRWFVFQQPPTDDPGVNRIDVVSEVAAMLKKDPHAIHVPVMDLPPQKKKLVLDTPGVVHLGRSMADAVLSNSE